MEGRNAAPGCAKEDGNKPRICSQCEKQTTLPTVLRFAAQAFAQLCVLWGFSLRLFPFCRRGFLPPAPLSPGHTTSQAGSSVWSGRPQSLGIQIFSKTSFIYGLWAFLLGCCSVLCKSLDSSALPNHRHRLLCLLAWKARWHSKLPAKQAKGPSSLSKYFLGYSICFPAHIFLRMHHVALHLQGKLRARREKSRSAQPAQCQLPHASNSSLSHSTTSYKSGLHPGQKCQLLNILPKEFQQDLHLTMVL